ncbi:hypothetical protein CYMTET_44015 [Cymbomonas tetramitiformis]|uniref:Uncharacterized protein n=1 Tax=Cymbomonas tetramitiformis TaxID=36881 RepID=A0AAE0C281_9CHLO|nr:hypothetical protein CYMTET_44015 [Cymbomonas tetramitiformis]
MSKEKYEVISAAVQEVSSWDAAEALEGGLGDSSLTEPAVQMQRDSASSLQPYLSAVNNYHENMGYPGPTKGQNVSLTVKGMSSASSLQVQASKEAGEEETMRTWLLARHVLVVHAHGLGLLPVGRAETELLWACAYVVSAFVICHLRQAGGWVWELRPWESAALFFRLPYPPNPEDSEPFVLEAVHQPKSM